MDEPLNLPDAGQPATKSTIYHWRSLIVALEVGGAIVALLSRVDGVWSALIVWTGLLIAAHVFANAWGTRVGYGRRNDACSDDPPPTTGRPIRFAPLTLLSAHAGLRWPILLWIGTGAALGGAAGTLALRALYGPRLGIDALVLGGVSATMLGGYFAFLTSSFLGVGLRALHEASRSRTADAGSSTPSVPAAFPR